MRDCDRLAEAAWLGVAPWLPVELDVTDGVGVRVNMYDAVWLGVDVTVPDKEASCESELA